MLVNLTKVGTLKFWCISVKMSKIGKVNFTDLQLVNLRKVKKQ